jgi:DNA polymerase-1
MSSNDPNLQNIPTGDGYAREIKECFVASPNNLLLVADYSQVELRILAFLSQDANLLEAFENGEDIHARTAFFLFGDKTGADKATWKATSEQRRIAKSVNFGVIYGITGFGLAKTLDCSPWEAQQYVEAFYAKYPGVRTCYDTLLANARTNGYVETYFGRKRYIA